MLSVPAFQELVRESFSWLVKKGFEVNVFSYGFRGLAALVEDDDHWLRLAWETREDAILLTWGEVLPSGRFNEDPHRLIQPPQDLLRGVSETEIEEAGHVGGDHPEAVAAALTRLAALTQDAELPRWAM